MNRRTLTCHDGRWWWLSRRLPWSCAGPHYGTYDGANDGAHNGPHFAADDHSDYAAHNGPHVAADDQSDYGAYDGRWW